MVIASRLDDAATMCECVHVMSDRNVNNTLVMIAHNCNGKTHRKESDFCFQRVVLLLLIIMIVIIMIMIIVIIIIIKLIITIIMIVTTIHIQTNYDSDNNIMSRLLWPEHFCGWICAGFMPLAAAQGALSLSLSL